MSGWVLLGLFGVIQSIYVYMLSASMSKPVETERVKKLTFIVNLLTMVLSLQHYACFALNLIGLVNIRTEAMLFLVGQRPVILDPIFIPSSYLDSVLLSYRTNTDIFTMARLSALSGLVFFLASGAQAFVPSPLAKMPTMTKAVPRSKVIMMGARRGI